MRWLVVVGMTACAPERGPEPPFQVTPGTLGLLYVPSSLDGPSTGGPSGCRPDNIELLRDLEADPANRCAGHLFDVRHPEPGPELADCLQDCGEDPLDVPFVAPMWSETGDACLPGARDAWEDMPPRLARYCVARPRDLQFTDIEVPWGLGAAGMVVAPAGSVGTGGAACDLGDASGDGCTCPSCALHAWAQRQTVASVDLASGGETRGVAWMTLLDTAPTGPVGPFVEEVAPHGQILGGMVQEALATFRNAGEGDVRLGQRHAMPLSLGNGGISWELENGGDFGGVDWLALSVVRSVETWRAAPGGTTARPLVLNLSLAFHGRSDQWGIGPDPLEWRIDVQALYSALQYARCAGALVVAATGNRTGGVDPTTGAVVDDDPMLPAAWAHPDHDVSAWTCRCGFEVDAPWAPGATVSCDAPEPANSPAEPLVFAIGGLAHDALPIEVSRPALSAVAAPSQHAAIEGAPPLTGTSVGTAWASAQAALSWSTLDADLTAAELVDRLLADPGTSCPVPDAPSSSDLFGPSAAIRAVATPRTADTCVGIDAAADLDGSTRAFETGTNVPATTVAPISPAPTSDPYPELSHPGPAYAPYSAPAPVVARCFTCGVDVASRQLWLDLDTPAMTSPDPVEDLELWVFVDPLPGALPDAVYALTSTYVTDPSLWDLDDLPANVARAVVTFDQGDTSYLSEVMVVGTEP